MTRLPLRPADLILLMTDRSNVFSPAFPILNFIYSPLFTVPPESAFRQDIAASSGAIMARTRMPAIMHAAILLVLLFLIFILKSSPFRMLNKVNYKALQFSLQDDVKL